MSSITNLTNQLNDDLQMEMYVAADKVMFRLRSSDVAQYVSHRAVSLERRHAGHNNTLNITCLGLLGIFSSLLAYLIL